MAIEEKQFVQQTFKGIEKNEKGNTSLLRLGVILLSVVSFYTTANGMREYIFKGNGVIAYAASAAIQGILLALSMNLPDYLLKIWKRGWHGFWRFILCFCAIILTLVTIFCSSWFSYVYIADTIHQESWGTDSELLVQQTYRSELYDARDYAHTYRLYLEESIGEDILALENQARQLPDATGGFEIDWEEENARYGRGSESMAVSYMATVIDIMELALEGSSSQENRDIAAVAIADAKGNIEDRIENIQEELSGIRTSITGYNNQIENLTRRINNAAEGTDTTALSNLVNQNIQLIDNETQRQVALQTEDMQLRDALQRLPVYESYLGLNNSTSSISIRQELIQLQSEFFKKEPNINLMLEIATKIFDDLRNASQGPSGEEASMTTTNDLTYTNLLMQMNRLIRRLTDYSEIKEIENELERMIAGLRQAGNSLGSEENITSSGDSDRSVSGNMQLEIHELSMTEDTALDVGQTSVSDNNSVSGNDSVSDNDSTVKDTTDSPEDSEWKEKWGDRLNELKAQISAMPVYSSDENTGNGEDSILSEAQTSILRNYDRNKSSNELDDIIRRYVADHSAIYQGIIYLQSPYRSLAIFAFILAFSFDIAGFIFGVVIQGSLSDKEPDTEDKGIKTYMEVADGGSEKLADWSILETLNKYVVLTGDYESRDGIYYYKVFRNGLLEKWTVHDKHSYDGGIYIQDKMDPGMGEKIDSGENEILFAGQPNGPIDGIYRNCHLMFDEGGLILVKQNEQRFIASVNEYVPVHSYNAKLGENQTIPMKRLAIQEVDAQVAVVALNAKGTQVAAVYMIENYEN